MGEHPSVQPDLFDRPSPAPERAFDGGTYEPARDYARLDGQLGRVFRLMRDGHWRTLDEIKFVVGGSEAAVSARLRDLRKPKYGSRQVERRHLQRGLFEYRLLDAGHHDFRGDVQGDAGGASQDARGDRASAFTVSTGQFAR